MCLCFTKLWRVYSFYSTDTANCVVLWCWREAGKGEEEMEGKSKRISFPVKLLTAKSHFNFLFTPCVWVLLLSFHPKSLCSRNLISDPCVYREFLKLFFPYLSLHDDVLMFVKLNIISHTLNRWCGEVSSRLYIVWARWEADEKFNRIKVSSWAGEEDANDFLRALVLKSIAKWI